jgi:hypothetical protein
MSRSKLHLISCLWHTYLLHSVLGPFGCSPLVASRTSRSLGSIPCHDLHGARYDSTLFVFGKGHVAGSSPTSMAKRQILNVLWISADQTSRVRGRIFVNWNCVRKGMQSSSYIFSILPLSSRKEWVALRSKFSLASVYSHAINSLSCARGVTSFAG